MMILWSCLEGMITLYRSLKPLTASVKLQSGSWQSGLSSVGANWVSCHWNGQPSCGPNWGNKDDHKTSNDSDHLQMISELEMKQDFTLIKSDCFVACRILLEQSRTSTRVNTKRSPYPKPRLRNQASIIFARREGFLLCWREIFGCLYLCGA